MSATPSDIVFSAAVKAVQSRRGSRDQMAARGTGGGWPERISADLAGFIGTITTCYIATASAGGQPTIQHRGGPPGFLVVVDDTTIAFADFAGNQQYVTTGNLTENSRICLFLIDCENRRRVKIWGHARTVDDDPALIARLTPAASRARVQQAVIITVETFDVNCSQHIPQKFDAADVASTIKTFQARVRELDAENGELKARIAALEHGA